jgi:hypothetical protein
MKPSQTEFQLKILFIRDGFDTTAEKHRRLLNHRVGQE